MLNSWIETFRMIQSAQWMLGYAKSSGNNIHPGWLYRSAPFEDNWRVS